MLKTNHIRVEVSIHLQIASSVIDYMNATGCTLSDTTGVERTENRR